MCASREEPSNSASMHVHSVAWMSLCIPCLQCRMLLCPFHLKAHIKKSGRRTKRVIANISLNTLGWNEAPAIAFRRLQDPLLHAKTFSQGPCTTNMRVQ